jgi:2,4-dienoyl-CoA reductase-like NADH-dependent reductase (Old Yellow Enzyme family)
MKIKNRFMRSATHDGRADALGHVTEELIAHYEELANKFADVINQTKIEYLSICRPFIREPELINRWAGGDTAPVTCISCTKCLKARTQCIFNK